MKRYYSPSLDRGFLDAEQSHHCAQVMRQAVGDHFSVFDGHGLEAKARITEIAKDEVKYQILSKASSPRANHPVWLAQRADEAEVRHGSRYPEGDRDSAFPNWLPCNPTTAHRASR